MDHHQSNGGSAQQAPPRPLQMGAKGAYIVRLLMVGDSACGKTSLVLRFDQNVFSTKFVTTIGVDYRDKMVKIENTSMRLQLWDTAGQERFRSLTSNFFGRADGFVLTFDISNRPSFDHVVGWMRDIKTRAPPDCDIVLCGNKSDLDNDRVVSYEEGKQLADEYGVQFFETSALTGQNVDKMFTALATTIKHKRIDDLESMQNGGHAGAGGAGGANGIHGASSADNGSTGGESRTINLNSANGSGGGGGGAGAKAASCCQ
jgi:small GTP-binding protein